MYKYIVYHITIYKDNEYYRYEQKKNPDNIPKRYCREIVILPQPFS